MIDYQGNLNQQLITSQDIQVCLEYLYLIFKYSTDHVIDMNWFGEDHLFGILMQPIPNCEPFPIYEFEKKNSGDRAINEKDFIGRPMMFIEDRYQNDLSSP